MKSALITLSALVWLVAVSPAGAETVGDPVIAADLTIRGGAVFFDRPEFDSVVLVEFPFTLQRNEYEFFQPDSSGNAYFARIFAQVNLFGSDGLPLDSANTYFSAAVADTAEASQADYTLFNSLALVIAPGIYSARLTVIDAVSKREGRFFYDRLIVEPPVQDGLALGAKTLAFGITYVGESPTALGSGVPRNGYQVRYNPLGVYSTHDTAAFLYAELYNLDYSENSPSDYILSFASLDGSGEVVRQLGTKVRQKPGRTAVVVESFDIGGWKAGAYLLQVRVSDPSASREIVHEIPLRILAPSADAGALAETFGDEGPRPIDLGTQLCLVHYILTPVEKTALEGLNDAGKLTFLDQYWPENDTDPSTAALELREEMYQRYLYANNFFSVEEGKTDGWKTDQGRILMTHGAWDRIEDVPHPVNGYPYKVWYYDEKQGGALFVFQDKDGFGDYRLVHSTADGEYYDHEWDDALKSGTVPFE